MKNAICTGAGIVGSAIAALFGGWDAALISLVIFMSIDYVTGLLVAGVFHNSEKTPNGALESRAGWKGLCRKGVTLLVVLVAYRLDLVIGANFIRDAVGIGFIANEAIPILENAGLMGVPIRKNLVSPDRYGIKCPYSMKPTRVVVHNTGNDAAAKNEVIYMITNDNEVSFHAAVDDVEIIQGIPLTVTPGVWRRQRQG